MRIGVTVWAASYAKGRHPDSDIMPLKQPEWIASVVSMLSDDDVETRRQGFNLKQQNVPGRLFRYRDINAIRELESSTIWLSAAEKFNDPFDCTVSVDFAPAMQVGLGRAFEEGAFTATCPEILARTEQRPNKLAALDELFADGVVRQLGEQYREKAAGFFGQFLDKQSSEATVMFSRGWQRRLKIAAFSEVPESLVLWAHYASDHKGFCIEYAFSTLTPADPRIECLFPVVYDDGRFSLADYIA